MVDIELNVTVEEHPIKAISQYKAIEACLNGELIGSGLLNVENNKIEEFNVIEDTVPSVVKQDVEHEVNKFNGGTIGSSGKSIIKELESVICTSLNWWTTKHQAFLHRLGHNVTDNRDK